MYYEEDWIDGKLCYKTNPTDRWRVRIFTSNKEAVDRVNSLRLNCSDAFHYEWHMSSEGDGTLAPKYIIHRVRKLGQAVPITEEELRLGPKAETRYFTDGDFSDEEWDNISKGREPKPKYNPDPVNRPSHYTNHPSGVECIDITKHMNFCRGNAIKYIWRAGEKGDLLEDLKKAEWYIRCEIERVYKEQYLGNFDPQPEEEK